MRIKKSHSKAQCIPGNDPLAYLLALSFFLFFYWIGSNYSELHKFFLLLHKRPIWSTCSSVVFSIYMPGLIIFSSILEEREILMFMKLNLLLFSLKSHSFCVLRNHRLPYCKDFLLVSSHFIILGFTFGFFFYSFGLLTME